MRFYRVKYLKAARPEDGVMTIEADGPVLSRVLSALMEAGYEVEQIGKAQAANILIQREFNRLMESKENERPEGTSET